MEVRNIARQARAASKKLALVSAETKNAVLITLAQKLMSQQSAVLAANAADIKDARQNGLSDALIDRLLLTPERLEGSRVMWNTWPPYPTPLVKSLPNARWKMVLSYTSSACRLAFWA
jgi:gamma-glutamyl phosphate reductase